MCVVSPSSQVQTYVLRVRDSGTIAPLVMMCMKSPNSDVQDCALRTMVNLLGHPLMFSLLAASLCLVQVGARTTLVPLRSSLLTCSSCSSLKGPPNSCRVQPVPSPTWQRYGLCGPWLPISVLWLPIPCFGCPCICL